MSKILSAIADSEQTASYQYQPVSNMHSNVGTARPSRPWLRYLGLSFVPVIGVVGYLSWQVVAQGHGSEPVVEVNPLPIKQVTSSVAQAATPVVADDPEVRFLTYPELQTEPLPMATASAVAAPERAYPNEEGVTSQDAPQVIPADPMEAVEWDLEALDYSDISPELAAQLKSAIAATDEGEPESEAIAQAQPATPIGSLPADVQNRIPTLNFNTHIYASEPSRRWVKVNGREAYEGDDIAPGVQLLEIKPREVVFSFENYRIAMAALSEW